MSSETCDLERLVEGCRKEDSGSRKKLYELYAPAMYAVCVRYVQNRETAKDIMQDGFVKIFTKIDTFQGGGSFEGWMRKIFVTTAIEYLRETKTMRQHVSIDTFGDEVADDFENELAAKLSAEEIMQCISDLPEGFRTVFNLYVVEEYSHAEIAKMLNIQEVTSRSQLARARRILQIKLYEQRKQQRL